MPSVKYPLERNGPEELEISWEGQWKNMTIRHKSKEIGVISNKKELENGGEFFLEDGSTLKVKLGYLYLFSPELQLLRNGQPIPNSAYDYNKLLKNAYYAILFIGGLSLFPAVADIIRYNFILEYHIGLVDAIIITSYVIYAILYFALGFLVKRKSLIALGVAIGLFVLSEAIYLFYLDSVNWTSNWAPDSLAVHKIRLVLDIVISSIMIRGFIALQNLRKYENRKGENV